MMKKVILVALRDNKGATGGPGGVLFMLRKCLGDSIGCNIKCEYQFNPVALDFRLKSRLNKMLFYLKTFFNKNAFYVAHDVDSAYILARCNRKYSLVYHNQGPLLQERKNFGFEVISSQAKKIKKKERLAFIKAHSLHFPSLGASDMYFKNQYRVCELAEVKLGLPLYNTIPLDTMKVMDCIKASSEYLTLFSLGTLTNAKGQDRVLLFLKEYLSISKKPVRYVFVGKGPLKDFLLDACQKLKESFPTFIYEYFECLSHSEIMYLHSISDLYIMLHRLSIFDFATLEAMSQNTAVALSPIGGNMDFDKKSNIVFIDDDYHTSAGRLASADIDRLKNLNKVVFEKYFSATAFKEEYVEMIQQNVEK